jgi:hypothetical protein
VCPHPSHAGILFYFILFLQQVSLYDIYLEVCPSRWTGIEPGPDPREPDEDEFDDDEEDPETFSRRTTSSIRRFR